MNQSTNYLEEWAIYYNKIGFSVIPLNGKIPLIKWSEYQEKRADEKQIKEWWAQYPKANIGCVTGAISGRLIVDVDGERGKNSISQYTIPITQTVRTRRGYQIHFNWNNAYTFKTTITDLFPHNDDVSSGIDIRGEGGICILPPSKCSDETNYEWKQDLTTPLAEAPEWLIELLSKQDKKLDIKQNESKEPWLEEILQGVGEGDRHGSLLKLAGYYFNCFPSDVALLHLRSWNSKNNPPIPTEEFEQQLRDLQQRFVSGEYETTFKEPRKLELLSSVSLVKNYSKPPQWLVPGLIPQNTRTIFSGWQGRGKSFSITDLVIEVSRKKGQGKWLGEFEVAQGPVIYVDNENAKNLVAHRLENLLGPKGLTTHDLDLYWIIGSHFKITSDKDYYQLREQVKEVKPVLLILDSLASAHSLDENTSKDMRYLFDDLIAPFCEEFKCGVICLDHERKSMEGTDDSGGKRLRGSGAKGDAVDTLLALSQQNGITYIEHSKSRYSRRHLPFVVSIDNCETGVVVRYGGELNP